MKPNRPTPRYTITKTIKFKVIKRILKAEEKNRVNYKGYLPPQGCQLISLPTETEGQKGVAGYIYSKS